MSFTSILEHKIFQNTKIVKKDPFLSEFKLPISYLSPDKIHTLSPIVAQDLELHIHAETETTNTNNHSNLNSFSKKENMSDINKETESEEKKEKEKNTSLREPGTESKEPSVNMYEYLLSPNNKFSKNTISSWNKKYTNDIPFLQDSQKVLKNMEKYVEKMESSSSPSMGNGDFDKLQEIWKETKEEPLFLEKYNYIELDYLKNFNDSESFLQSMSVLNMSSPILSFIVPVLFLVFPFLILKIQGIPITFEVYVNVLKDLAKHHFIGKTLHQLDTLSWDKVVYIIMTFVFYILQIYQNFVQCSRFYRNISSINEHLTTMKQWLKHSITSMDTFISLNSEIPNYSRFCEHTLSHKKKLSEFAEMLEQIHDFSPGFSKIAEIGYLLKCFYALHSNEEYETSLRYSAGFEGFVDNLKGIYNNIVLGKLNYAIFSEEPTMKCEFKQQYYPPLIDQMHMKNNCSLSENNIITGPNASGKTTMLKTTTLNIIFTQQFGCGFYTSCIINPYTHIHSYLNIPDTSGRDSLFQAESRRCKEILDVIREPELESRKTRHFCIFDELYSGTNPSEATKSSYAFLLYLSSYQNVDFILTTHYVSICKKLKKQGARIANYKMEVIENPDSTPFLFENAHSGAFSSAKSNGSMHIEHAQRCKKPVEYTYKMKKGVSKIQGAILILEEMKYPQEIIDTIRAC
jgi:hypothetical protein